MSSDEGSDFSRADELQFTTGPHAGFLPADVRKIHMLARFFGVNVGHGHGHARRGRGRKSGRRSRPRKQVYPSPCLPREQVEHLTVNALKDLCRTHQLPVSGTKAVLIARLIGTSHESVAYDGPDPEEKMESFFNLEADDDPLYSTVEPPDVPGMEEPERAICDVLDDVDFENAMERVEEVFNQTSASPFYWNTTWKIRKPSVSVQAPDGSKKEVTFPLDDESIKLLSSICTPAPFGRGEQTIVDQSVRNTLQLDPSKFTIVGDEFQKLLSTELETLRKTLSPNSEEVTATLYKLLFYPPGSFFKSHVDTQRSPDMFATLVIELQAPGHGGKLTISHQGKQVDCTHKYPRAHTLGVGVTAFFADCLHEVEEIIYGHRVALVYNLTRRGTRPQQAQPFSLAADAVDSLFKVLDKLQDECTYLGYLLAHQYAVTSVMPDALKGSDRALYDQLQHAGDRFDLYVAPVSINETGEAGGDDPYEPFLAQRLRTQVTWEGRVGDGAIGFRETYLVDPRKPPKNYGRNETQYVWLHQTSLERLVPLRWINNDPHGRAELVKQDVSPSGNEGTGFALSYIHFALFIHKLEKNEPERKRKSDEDRPVVPAAAEKRSALPTQPT